MHSREVDRQSRTGLIFLVLFCRSICFVNIAAEHFLVAYRPTPDTRCRGAGCMNAVGKCAYRFSDFGMAHLSFWSSIQNTVFLLARLVALSACLALALACVS